LVYQDLYDSAPAGERKVDLLFSIAELQEQRGLLVQSLEGYMEVIGSESVSELRITEAVAGAARVLMFQGEPQEALDMVDANVGGVEDGAMRVSLLQIKVEALRTLNRYEEADRLGEELMGQAGDDEMAILMAKIERAQGLATAGDYPEAIAAYQEIYSEIEDQSTKASMQLAIAQVQGMAGNLPQARAAFDGISEEFPALLEAIFDAEMGLSFMDRQAGDNTAALARYNRMRAPDVGSQVWRLEQIAQTLEAMGREDEALEGYEAILIQYPGRIEAVVASKSGVARLRRSMGELEVARGLYSEVAELAVDPFQRDWARLHAATILLEQGLLDDAFFSLREVEVATTDPEVILQARMGMVSIYQEKERFDLALEIVNETALEVLGLTGRPL
jgi:tetratricopeptide (TPR) repeat protein